jgi:NADH-quinone oxidoreductase subunit N
MQADWLDILPVLILAGGGLLVLGAGAFLGRRPPWLLFALALATALAAGLAAVWMTPSGPAFLGMLDLGGYARFFDGLFMVITSLTLLLVHRYSQVRGFAGDELFALILYAALGMVLVAGALNWLIFFLGLELLSIPLYVLIAIRRDEAVAQEAAIKYFILGAVASAVLAFGVALLYAASGALDIQASLSLRSEALPLPVTMVALALILVGVGFKTSLVPFHLWAPDVYQGAATPVTAFLSTGSKVALFAALIRFTLNLAEPAWEMAWPVLWVMAALTMTAGNLTAIYQTRVKRLLAYSSIAQMGYLLMGLVAVKQGALPALLFYLAVYSVMDLGAFGMLGALSGKGEDLDELVDCQGLGYSHPWRSAVLGLCLFSLAGLPPTGGFLGKVLLFWAVLKAHYPILAVIGVVTVIISIYYYFKVLVSFYLRPASPESAVPEADLAVRLAAALIFLLILWLGLFPTPLLTVINRIAALIAG